MTGTWKNEEKTNVKTTVSPSTASCVKLHLTANVKDMSVDKLCIANCTKGVPDVKVVYLAGVRPTL